MAEGDKKISEMTDGGAFQEGDRIPAYRQGAPDENPSITLGTAAALDEDEVLQPGNNLSEISDVEEARANLGLTIGRRSIWIPAKHFTPLPSGGCAPLAAIGGGAFDPIIETLDFDASTIERAQCFIQIPNNWDGGTISVQVYWSHASTTTNFDVVWMAALAGYNDGDLLTDSDLGGTSGLSDTGGATDTLYVTAESAPLTVPSPSLFNSPDNDMICLSIGRFASNGGDTLAVDARLHGVKFWYGIDGLEES